MKAILDWKYNTNGDPMVDVGYFLMMFMQPAVYGYPALARLDLLMGKPDTIDTDTLTLKAIIIILNRLFIYLFVQTQLLLSKM